MSTTTFQEGTGSGETGKRIFMKFRCTEKKSRETGEKCLIPVGQNLERSREIINGKLVQTVFVDGVQPYKIVYRRKNETDKDESSDSEEDDGEE